MRHSSKNKYMDVDAVQRAAAKYTAKYGFMHKWYLCEECSYYHLTTVTDSTGTKVLSLDAIQQRAGY